MNKIALVLFLAVAASGCLDQPAFVKSSGNASLSQGTAPVLVASIDQDGGTTGLISGVAGGAQILSAGAGSGVSGSTVSFPPGALGISTNVTMTEGEQLATNGDVTSALGLGSDGVSTSGSPVAILSEAKIDAAAPFAVALSIPDGANLAETQVSYAVLFKVYHAYEDKVVIGIIPPSEVSVDDGSVTFKTKHFGVFQVVTTKVVVVAPVVVETKAPVQTKAQVVAAATPAASTSTGTSSSTGSNTTKTSTNTSSSATPMSDVRVLAVLSPNASQNYGVGDGLTIMVQFSGPVTLDSRAVLWLYLNAGQNVKAISRPITNSNFIQFDYVVQRGDLTSLLDYPGTDALVIGIGQGPKDKNGRQVPLTLPPFSSAKSLGATSAIGIDAAWSTSVSSIGGRVLSPLAYDPAHDLLLTWGGLNGSDPQGDGARFEISSQVWTSMTSTGAPSARYGFARIWTGSRLLVWGGQGGTVQGDGALYDPGNDSWTSMAATGALSGRSWATTVWTGSKAIIWGGYDSDNLGDGKVYDPTANSWSSMNPSTTYQPVARAHHKAAWDSIGKRMFVFGGHGGGLESSVQDAAVYFDDCTSECWKSIDDANTPSARVDHVMVWTGTKLIVWGGINGSGDALADGGIYSSSATNPNGTWTPIPVNALVPGRVAATATWDPEANRMIVFGGRNAAGIPQTSPIAFDPDDGSWVTLSVKNAPSPMVEAASIYAAGSSWIFGGDGLGSSNSLGRYTFKNIPSQTPLVPPRVEIGGPG